MNNSKRTYGNLMNFFIQRIMIIKSNYQKIKQFLKYTFLARHSSGLLPELVSVAFSQIKGTQNLLMFFVFSICKNISIAIYERV